MSSTTEYSPGTAFITWLACLFGLCGIHRFYLGKPITGFLYLITFGFFGIGQLVDLVRLNAMVDDANLVLAERRQRLLGPGVRALPPPARDPREELRLALVRAAAAKGGALSVTQGVMATGKDFTIVEAALDDMVKSGYVDIDNDPETGIVIYKFGELA